MASIGNTVNMAPRANVVRFSGKLDGVAAGLPQSTAEELLGEALPKRGTFFKGSCRQGAMRALKKTLFRPVRGWILTLAMAPFTCGASLLLVGKSFLEGVVGVDSLFMKRGWLRRLLQRWFGFNLGTVKESGGRTLIDAFKEKMGRGVV